MITSTVELIKDRFDLGALFPDGGIVLQSDKSLGPREPIGYDGTEPIWHPRSPIHAKALVIVCRRCGEPSWAITRHCAERHGDTDVEVKPPRPGKVRPDWMQPNWI